MTKAEMSALKTQFQKYRFQKPDDGFAQEYNELKNVSDSASKQSAKHALLMRFHQAKEEDRGEKERLKLVRSRETKSTAGTMDLTLLELCSTFQIDIFGKDVDNQVKKVMVLGGIRAVPLPAAKLEQLKELLLLLMLSVS